MYAIVTKYVPCTNTRGSRISAVAAGVRPGEKRRASVGYGAYDTDDEAHIAARDAWIAKHCKPEHIFRSQERRLEWVTGTLPDGATVHVAYLVT